MEYGILLDILVTRSADKETYAVVAYWFTDGWKTDKAPFTAWNDNERFPYFAPFEIPMSVVVVQHPQIRTRAKGSLSVCDLGDLLPINAHLQEHPHKPSAENGYRIVFPLSFRPYELYTSFGDSED